MSILNRFNAEKKRMSGRVNGRGSVSNETIEFDVLLKSDVMIQFNQYRADSQKSFNNLLQLQEDSLGQS